nr:hypothetical protein XZYIHYVE_XZYIHYVE_CDS_0007 [Microvirus sp.]
MHSHQLGFLDRWCGRAIQKARLLSEIKNF